MTRLRTRSIIGFTLTLAAALAFALVVRDRGMAQGTGATGAPPPTYDYDPTVPGTQPPASPLLANPTTRSLRTHQLNVPVLVPLAEAQAVLPPGFNAVESASGSGTATIILVFFYQQQFERIGIGTFGPASGLVLSIPALNTNIQPNRVELILPTLELSDAPSVEAANAAFGPGSSRLAETKVEIKEEGGRLRFTYHVVDEALGLNVKVNAEGSAVIVARSLSDPAPMLFRTLDNGQAPNPPLRNAAQQDSNAVPTAEANLDLSLGGGRLRLPGGGHLTVIGVGPTVTFFRWVEFIVQPE
jgi:hypothetical protein